MDRNAFGAAWARLSPRLRRRLGGYDARHAGYGTTHSVTACNLTATPEGTDRGTVDVELCAVDTATLFIVRRD